LFSNRINKIAAKPGQSRRKCINDIASKSKTENEMIIYQEDTVRSIEYERARKRGLIKVCKSCGREFQAESKRHLYCSPRCKAAKAPVVYRFICPDPDGRS